MKRWGVCLVAVGCAVACAACTRASSHKKAKPKIVQQTAPEDGALHSKLALSSVEQRVPHVSSQISWLVLGGGSDPLSNQISIAQDVELARSLLGGEGLTLFASGTGALVSVQRDDRDTSEDAGVDALARQARVVNELALLLGPPGALQLRYEPISFPVDAPATRDHVLDVLRVALEGEGREDADAGVSSPLLIIASGHGERGQTARQNAMSLWGGWSLNVEDLAQALEAPEHTRPTRLVVTTCYGGGFAELAFLHADARDGTRTQDHCGLFAAPWDDESSGCDPSPDRRQQESYSIHFLSALRGQGRDAVDHLADIDLGQDGQVSLREAHAWARIHSRSFDIPTTTSERYLREHTRSFEQERVRGGEPEVDVEERAVLAALASELELPDEHAAREKLRELDRIMEDVHEQVAEAQHSADDAFYALRIALLERWPLLDHTWDPRAVEVVKQEAASIEQLLFDSELAAGNVLATRELDDALAQQDSVRVARARVLRLVRAYETLRLASALKRRDRTRYAHYQALRECERFVPALRVPRAASKRAASSPASDAVEAEAHAE